MTEERAIEILGEAAPDWRDHFDDPFDALSELGIEVERDEEDYGELRFE